MNKLEKFMSKINDLPNKVVIVLIYGLMFISDLAAIFGVLFGFIYIVYKLLRMVFCK